MLDILKGKKPVAVITSDWHMALGAWKKLPDVKGDAEFSLSQIVDMAIGLKVPLIAAGDLFDTKNPDSYSVNAVATHMARMRQAGLPVYYVQGQHEMATPTWFSLFEGCHNVHDKHFEIGGVNFFGYDYFLPRSVEDSYSRFKPADVLITHQVWSELLPFNGQEFCCSYNLVHEHVKYKAIVSGDYHSHFKAPIGSSVFVSPGSICLQDLKESCNKAAWVLTDDLGFTSAPYKTRRLIQCKVESDSDLHTLVKMADSIKSDDYPNGIGKPIIRVKYASTIDNVSAAVSSAFKGKAYYDLSPIIEGSSEVEDTDTQQPEETVLEKVNIDECFQESLSNFCDPSDRGYGDLLRLWGARSTEAMRKELEDIANSIKTGGHTY